MKKLLTSSSLLMLTHLFIIFSTSGNSNSGRTASDPLDFSPISGGSRRSGSSPSNRETWRASMRERLDIRAGLRRDAEMERRRLLREREFSRRRRRFGRYVGDPDTFTFSSRSFQAMNDMALNNPSVSNVWPSSTPSLSLTNPSRGRGAIARFSASAAAGSSESAAAPTGLSLPAVNPDNARLPPLREIIFRRLRRRNAELNQLDDEIMGEAHNSPGSPSLLSQSLNTSSHVHTSGGSRERSSRHREMLSWMVNQLTIDQQHANIAASAALNYPGAGNAPSDPRLPDPQQAPNYGHRAGATASRTSSGTNTPRAAAAAGNSAGNSTSSNGNSPPLPSRHLDPRQQRRQ